VSSTRRYSSALREERRVRTRARVVAAAAESFLTVGYRATTVAAIASAAEVSQQTVYNLVGGKPELLKVVYDQALAADDKPVAIIDRSEADAVRSAPTAVEALDRYAHLIRVLHERSLVLAGLIYAQARAGEAGIAELVDLIESEKLAGSHTLVEIAESFGPLGGSIGRAQARDVAWLLISVDNAERLVHGRGWSWDAYEKWLAASLVFALLGSQP
jgi:AcrR family transcriptional regulator